MKNIFKTLIVCSAMCGGMANASVQPCPYCPEIPPPEISYEDILDAISNNSYKYALEITGDYAIQELIKYINSNPEGAAKVYEKVKDKLAEILNDETLSEAEKGQLILSEIEKTISPYKAEPVGAINLQLSHSIDYGTTKLTWDKNIEVDSCEGGYAGWYCPQYESYGTECAAEWEWRTVVWVDYVKKVPDYYVYRVINGSETLITKLKGKQEIERAELSLSPDIYKTIKSIYDAADLKLNVEDDKAFYHDHRSDLREIGTTLEYKVVSDNSPYKLTYCGSSEIYEAQASFDMDGDRIADFIPKEEYPLNDNSWLVPVITLLVLN